MKRGYMRSIEAILAMLLLLGLYHFLLARVYVPVDELQRDPSLLGISLLSALESQGVLIQELGRADLKSIDSKLRAWLPGRVGYALEVEYGVSIKLRELAGRIRDDSTLLLVYNFPRVVDRGSIDILRAGYALAIEEPKFVWYEVPIVIRNYGDSFVDKAIEIGNISLKANGTLDNRTLVFFFGEKEAKLNFTWYPGASLKEANASLVVEIPEMRAGESVRSWLFYATNESRWRSTYYPLEALSHDLDIKIGASRDSGRAEIVFRIDKLGPTEDVELSLRYSLATQSQKTYQSLPAPDNTGIELEHENYPKEGSLPVSLLRPPADVYSIDYTTSFINTAKLRLYLWYLG
jgi:hypothetical protein